jgi:hypothetical protein
MLSSSNARKQIIESISQLTPTIEDPVRISTASQLIHSKSRRSKQCNPTKK